MQLLSSTSEAQIKQRIARIYYDIYLISIIILK